MMSLQGLQNFTYITTGAIALGYYQVFLYFLRNHLLYDKKKKKKEVGERFFAYLEKCHTQIFSWYSHIIAATPLSNYLLPGVLTVNF